MVGVMMSYKTLNDMPSSWTDVWVRKELLSNIFLSDSRLYNCIHFADYDGMPHLADSLTRVVRYGGDYIHAIQLDMVWPEPFEVRMFRKFHPKIEIVLQVGMRALEHPSVRMHLGNLSSMLDRYGKSIDHVLLDGSMGRGVPMRHAFLRPFVRALQGRHFNVAVAGGLGPSSLELVRPLVKNFPTLSIDAQGKLRPSGDAHDPLNLQYVLAYARGAYHMFGEH